MMKSGKKRLNKKKAFRKKQMFFIIVTAYITIFMITIGITLSWFGGSTWQDKALYMGGPVYMDFVNNAGNKTSGAGALVMDLPENWTELYPGMNVNIEASALLIGTQWEHIDGENQTVVKSTQSILRTRIMVESKDPNGNVTELSKSISQPILNALQEYNDGTVLTGNTGKWMLDTSDDDGYFYYIASDFEGTDVNTALMEVSGKESEDAVVHFLEDATVTLPWVLENNCAGYTLKITVVFQALQAFIPYLSSDVGVTMHHSGNRLVQESDRGMARPLYVSTAKPVFKSAFSELYDDGNGYEDEL
ncbi:MAG: hypothetical protein IJW28_05810 [Clostridia bacterium]|nr:hypothetical protein [Clostridia bacterium]